MASAKETELPPLFRRHVRRPRLTGMIDESVAQSVIVTGAAGFGKTTLAEEWSQGRDDVVWYRATRASADIAAFSAGVAAATATLAPGAGELLMQRLRVAEAPEKAARALAELLAKDLAAWPRGAWLIVDDYQFVVDSPPVEEFVDWLLTLTRVRLVVTTRRRPGWASARRALNGELTEIGQDKLAMTDDEAALVLEDRPSETVRDLVARAEGWPALIGLAALASASEVPGDQISDALFRYFAEEVLRQEPPEMQELMLLASVPVTIDPQVVRDVLGVDDPEPFLDRLRDDGLLRKSSADSVQFHPLLREFLRKKLESTKPELVQPLVARAIETSSTAGRWDEAFELAMSVSDRSTAARTIGEAGPTLLAAGQLGTLEEWLDRCGGEILSYPSAVVVRVSVLLRRGQLSESAALATDLATRLTPDHPSAAHGWYLAGQARHLNSQYASALACHEKAGECAETAGDQKDALWGRFMASLEGELSDATDLLGDLARLEPLTLNDRLRLATGRIVLAMHSGSFAGVWDEVEPLLNLRQYSDEPMIRSSYTALSAYAANARGHYKLAKTLSHEAFEYCAKLGLDFATGHCLAHVVTANIGLRDFPGAQRTLSQLEDLLTDCSEPFLMLMFQVLSLKLDLAMHGPKIAFSSFVRPIGSRYPPVPFGELLGLASLAAAGAGAHDKALEMSAEARATTNSIEAHYYSRFAEALTAWLDSPCGGHVAELEAIAGEALESDLGDAIVVAYRTCPRLLKALASAPEVAAGLERVMLRAGDSKLAIAAGLHVEHAGRPTAHRVGRLTPRETEVLSLMAQGLSNSEISRELFVTISTTKAHVHNILKKLGVSTRLQAVVRARELLSD